MFDMGTSSTRAGYAGEDTPRVMFPTSYGYVKEDSSANDNAASGDGDVTMSEASTTTDATTRKSQYYVGDNKINSWRKNMEIRNPMTDGLGKWIPFIDF